MLAANVQLAADIAPGPSSSGVEDLTVLDGDIYFAANDGSGRSLWKHSPATSSSFPLIDAATSQPINGWDLQVFGSQLVFGSNTGLMSYDPATETQLQLSPMYPGELTVIGDQLFFRGNDGNVGEELWSYDALAGVSIVADLDQSASDSNPENFVAYDGDLFFWSMYNTTEQTQTNNNLYRYDPATQQLSHFPIGDQLTFSQLPYNIQQEVTGAGTNLYLPYTNVFTTTPG